jgi:hypothetical protein
MLKSIAIATIILSTPSGLLAQQGGTEQERQACAPDVKRHCAKVLDQGDLVILDCLKQNRPKLSPSCDKVLVDHGQ